MGIINSSEADEILSAILDLPLEIKGHYDILPKALILARKYNLTVYDSLFLTLAEERNAELVTADQELSMAYEKSIKSPGLRQKPV